MYKYNNIYILCMYIGYIYIYVYMHIRLTTHSMALCDNTFQSEGHNMSLNTWFDHIQETIDDTQLLQSTIALVVSKRLIDDPGSLFRPKV